MGPDQIGIAAHCFILYESRGRQGVAVAVGRSILAFPSKRLLDEDQHIAQRPPQDVHIVGIFGSLDQATKVRKGGHLIHT